MVVAVIFLSLLVSAGLRSTPSVLLVPLEESFGWSRSSISFAAALGIFLYGRSVPSPPPRWNTSACAGCSLAR